MNLNELAEKAFEKWIKNEPNKNLLPESRFEAIAAKHAFLAAFHLLSGVVEKQGEALEFYEEWDDGQIDMGRKARTALAATKLATEEMGK